MIMSGAAAFTSNLLRVLEADAIRGLHQIDGGPNWWRNQRRALLAAYRWLRSANWEVVKTDKDG